jgi:hypothetical protein
LGEALSEDMLTAGREKKKTAKIRILLGVAFLP